MKILKKSMIGLGVLVLAALLLIWFFPARLGLFLIAPPMDGVRLQQVGGLLWSGHADRVSTTDGQVLGKLQWQLSRMALLGKVQLQLQFTGPRLDFSGSMKKLPEGQVEWRDVQAWIDLSLLDGYPAKLPLGQPRGELRITVEHALLQGGWPLQLQASTQWSNALIKNHDGDIALGVLQLTAQAQNGVVAAQLRDDGHGPLRADGTLQLSPLGWRAEARLSARGSDPALRRWLPRLGRPDASGTVHIQRSGGMAIGLPPSTPDEIIH